jgi:hypothetical protein
MFYVYSDIAAKADIPPQNIVVRFSEAVDGFPLPKGHDVTNCDVLVNDTTSNQSVGNPK